MKKLFFFLLLSAGILASCSKDEAPEAGQLKASQSEVTLGGSAVSTADVTKEITLSGITGDLSVSVENSVAQWCSASASAVAAEGTATLTVALKAYSGNADRVAYVHVKSGIDELSLKIIQTGLAQRVEFVVVNEGQFTKGTGALSAVTYDGTTKYDVFRDVNGVPLGDVAQSLTSINGKYYVAINNSKMVRVVEPQTFKEIKAINYTQAGKPRFIAAISDTEAIVSDMQSQLVRINTKTDEIVEYIDISGKTRGGIEKMTVVGGKLFGADLGKGCLAVFDVSNVTASGMRHIESVKLNDISKTCKMIADKNGKLWVVTNTSAKLTWTCVDPATETVVKTVDIPFVKKGEEAYVEGCVTGTPWYTRVDTDRTRGRLYTAVNILVSAARGTSYLGVVTLDVDKDAINAETRVLPGVGMMYGMGVSPDGQSIYVCDCLDYTAQRGKLRKYMADGNEESFPVGIYPRMIHFTEYDQ